MAMSPRYPGSPVSSFRSVSVLIGAALTYFCSVGIVNAFGVFQEYYAIRPMREKTEGDIAWIGSFATFATFAFAAPAGFVIDKFNPQVCQAIGIKLYRSDKLTRWKDRVRIWLHLHRRRIDDDQPLQGVLSILPGTRLAHGNWHVLHGAPRNRSRTQILP